MRAWIDAPIQHDGTPSRPERGFWLDGTNDPALPAEEVDGSSVDGADSAAPNAPADADGTPSWAMPLCVAGGTAMFAMLASGLATGDSELVTAVGVALVLGLGSFVVFRRIAKFDGRSAISTILLAAMSVKLLGTLARFYVGQGVYDRSDATEYDSVGRQWANDYLSIGQMPKVNKWTSTNLVKLVVAEFYHYASATMIGGFIFFSWLSFVGMVFAWRGFKRVHPDAANRYMLFVLFAPSMMYWPSSIGKEALAIFGLGMATYGVGLIVGRAVWLGSAVAIAGALVTTYVRPHVGLVAMIGMAFALILRKRPKGQKIGTLVSIVVFAIAGSFVMGQVNEYFGTNVQTGEGVVEQGAAAEDRTGQGGSEFEPTPVFASPANFPLAVLTVMFRPYPWEAGSAQELFTSIESFAYGVLLVMSLRRLAQGLRRDRPLTIYAVVTTVVFIALFSNFANFGILARQRTQILPFLFMLLCIPARPRPERYNSLLERRIANEANEAAAAASTAARTT
jgi:hypothetical protein